MNTLCPSLRALAGVLLLSSVATADPSPRQRFPMTPAEDGALRLDAARFEALRERASVVLEGVPLPGEGEVALHLRRMKVAVEGATYAVDGVEFPLAEVADHLQLFTGAVVGDDDSHAFLAFSPEGTRGYVRRAGRMFHLRPESGATGGTTSSFVALEGDANAMSAMACGSSEVQQFLAVDPGSLVAPSLGGLETGGIPTVYECRVAVETDYEFFQLFGNQTEAANYVLTLFGAVSDIYLNDVGTIVTVSYVGLHTSGSDGWDKNDDTLDRLYAFRAAWKNGAAPVDADLYHFLSGVNMGGGIAWINALCSDSYGFGVSGNIDGGLTLPLSGPSPWDLVVVAHEMGHNFVTPHTHDYCPPIDQCAPNGYFGDCQTAQVCIPNGTIMSYCHLCSGGLSNIDLNFHPTVASAMRTAVTQSCLQEVVLAPELCVDQPDGVHVTVDPSSSPVGSVTFGLANCGTLTDPVNYTATFPSAETWVSVTPATGTVDVAASTLTVDVDATGLAFGMHTAILHLQNDADAEDSVDLPVSLMVLPPPFRPGDQLTGSVEGSDVDQASFDAVDGTKVKLNVDRTGGTGPIDVVLADEHAVELQRWTVAAGKVEQFSKKMASAGSFTLRVEGEGAGAFSIDTDEKLPKLAKSRTLKKQKAKGSSNFVDVEFRAVKGATIDVVVTPNAKVTAPVSLDLYDPNEDEVDVAAYTSLDGLSLTDVPLETTGTYLLRIHGPTGKKQLVTVKLTPTWPAGTDSVDID